METFRQTTSRRNERELLEGRRALGELLETRRQDLEAAIAARIFSISPPDAGTDPAYLEGLRGSLPTAIGFALQAVEAGEQRAPEVPPSLLAQARMAARSGVNLDTVLRRYLAGFSVLTEFVLEDAVHAGLPKGFLRELLRGQTATLDRLLAAVSEEYVREESSRRLSEEQHRADRVKRLLAGEPLDLSTFEYGFDAWHLGAVASGSISLKILNKLSSALGFRLLTVNHGDGTIWAWFESSHSARFTQLRRHLSSVAQETAVQQSRPSLALGEPGRGLRGWRFTHRQARAALPIALHGPEPFVRYADVALLASMLQDDLLATSLREIYLEPLQRGRDGGDVALRTLRAYIDAERNVSSAAAALGVNRNTVANRLRVIEEKIGRPLSTCVLEIEATLRLRGLTTLPT